MQNTPISSIHHKKLKKLYILSPLSIIGISGQSSFKQAQLEKSERGRDCVIVLIELGFFHYPSGISIRDCSD
ncbi:hypothetical protein L2E82_21780 [Cichorium intybus]|uniref:Uncharacterized protein n=1 Tax=Cichorium intybus TaxID=13427 RepID=A0ACB9DX41_CICIN|nr:hypothetical protein L2E82_21780 [Cichorium intybus]